MKVLHVMNQLLPSGAEMMLGVASDSFIKKGIEGHVLETSEEGGDFGKVLEKRGYIIKRQFLSKRPQNYLALYRLIRNERYGCVHIHSEGKRFPVAIVSVIARVPKIIATVHNVFPYKRTRRVIEVAKRRILRVLGVKYVSIGDSVQDNEQFHLCNKSIRIDNWLDISRFAPFSTYKRESCRSDLGVSCNQFLIISVGNCSVVKNHSLLLEALSLIDQKEIDWVYYHIGSGSCEAAEIELAKNLKIENRCRFLGRISNVEDILPLSDLYVMPSLKEGASIAVLEALACGVPAVLTKVPGLKDVKKYSPDTQFSELDPENLAEIMGSVLMGDSNQRRRAALETADRIRNDFSPEKGAHLYSEVYRGIHS